MRTWLKVTFWIAMVPAVLVLGIFLLAVFLTHGHGAAPLDVSLRIVMQDTGQPLVGVTVVIVRTRSALDDDVFFRRELEEALRSRGGPEVSARRGRFFFVWAEITDKDGSATIPSSLRITGYSMAGIRVYRAEHLPECILIEHPALGRTIVPIDPDSSIEEGEEPDTWRLDLGMITLPQ